MSEFISRVISLECHITITTIVTLEQVSSRDKTAGAVIDVAQVLVKSLQPFLVTAAQLLHQWGNFPIGL